MNEKKDDYTSSLGKLRNKEKKKVPQQITVPVKEKVERSTVELPLSFKRMIKKYCADKGVYFKDFATEALIEKMEREEKKK